MQTSFSKALRLGTILAATATPGIASEIMLQTIDGSVTISGELVGFENQTYTLRTAIGEMKVAASTVDCLGSACPVLTPENSEFRIAGSRALGDALIPALTVGYAQQMNGRYDVASVDGATVINISSNDRGNADISIEATDTRRGVGSLLSGDATFALASRPIRNREIRDFQAAGMPDPSADGMQHVVALDGLLLVTNPANPVRAITEVNAALAFAGRISNWADLGGPNAPINLYVRDADSGTREVFDNLVMRPNGLAVGANVTILDSDAAVADAVQADPFGLGFTNFTNGQEEGARALDIEGVCGLRTPATAFTIKTEEYPLTRLLYMYQAQENLPDHAARFIDYIGSEAGQQTVAEAGYIDQAISTETINSQGIRVASSVVNTEDFADFVQMRDMLDLLLSSERMSTTFRFETGSARLDVRGRADLDRLAERLDTEQFAGKEVLFVGFTDSVGDATLNQQLSQQRAEQVRQLIIAENPGLATSLNTRSVGFGEVSPLGCNETDTGRRINRRVEVWVKDIAAGDRI